MSDLELVLRARDGWFEASELMIEADLEYAHQAVVQLWDAAGGGNLEEAGDAMENAGVEMAFPAQGIRRANVEVRAATGIETPHDTVERRRVWVQIPEGALLFVEVDDGYLVLTGRGTELRPFQGWRKDWSPRP